MSLTKLFLESILLKPNTAEQQKISSVILPILEKTDTPLLTQLAVMSMMFIERTGDIDSGLKYIQESYEKIIGIIVENNLRLPEEESEVERIIASISEEGEAAAPTNVTAGIDPTTPRIKRKQKQEVENGTS